MTTTEDDCYVSILQNAKWNKRISNSCSDLTVDTSEADTCNNVGFHEHRDCKVNETKLEVFNSAFIVVKTHTNTCARLYCINMNLKTKLGFFSVV